MTKSRRKREQPRYQVCSRRTTAPNQRERLPQPLHHQQGSLLHPRPLPLPSWCPLPLPLQRPFRLQSPRAFHWLEPLHHLHVLPKRLLHPLRPLPLSRLPHPPRPLPLFRPPRPPRPLPLSRLTNTLPKLQCLLMPRPLLRRPHPLRAILLRGWLELLHHLVFLHLFNPLPQLLHLLRRSPPLALFPTPCPHNEHLHPHRQPFSPRFLLPRPLLLPMPYSQLEQAHPLKAAHHPPGLPPRPHLQLSLPLPPQEPPPLICSQWPCATSRGFPSPGF